MRQKLLSEKYGTEKIFVVPFSCTESVLDGFHSITEKDYDKLVDVTLSKGKFILRADAEEDITFQQIIPYVLVTDEAHEKFFATRRIAGESRLLGRLSLGIGGHINPIDWQNANCAFFQTHREMVLRGMAREIREEMTGFEHTKQPKPYGTVRDLGSSTPDHIGIVFTMIAQEPDEIGIRETDTLEPVWMTKKELVQNYEKFESWAQMIIEDMVIDKAAA